MTDRELLEAAARAAGLKVSPIRQEMRDADGYGHVGLWIHGVSTCWNPLRDDSDALRLAVKLGLNLYLSDCGRVDVDAVETLSVDFGMSDPYEATRRAIVLGAAEIGKTVDAPQAG